MPPPKHYDALPRETHTAAVARRSPIKKAPREALFVFGARLSIVALSRSFVSTELTNYFVLDISLLSIDRRQLHDTTICRCQQAVTANRRTT